MVKHHDRLTALYGAIADPTRREMLDRLRTGPRTVSDLGAPFGITLAAVGKHVSTLETSGLIRTVKRGRVRTCELVPGALDDADQWIARHTRFWSARLDTLADHLQGRP